MEAISLTHHLIQMAIRSLGTEIIPSSKTSDSPTLLLFALGLNLYYYDFDIFYHYNYYYMPLFYVLLH